MAEVTVSRFIRAKPPDIDRVLTPDMLIHYEGTFQVMDVEERNGGTVVRAKATGIQAEFYFEELEEGYRYEQIGSEGPFDEMETTLTYRNQDDGVEVTMTSEVSLGLRPRFLADRIGAWKRKGELRRALRNLENAI